MVKPVYRTARLWRMELPWRYNGRETNPYRLLGVHISAKLSFDEFQKGLEQALSGSGRLG